MELSSFEEISRWILSWGDQVEVIEPKALRDTVLASLEATKTIYQS